MFLLTLEFELTKVGDSQGTIISEYVHLVPEYDLFLATEEETGRCSEEAGVSV